MNFKEMFNDGLIKKPLNNKGDFKHWREEIIKQYHKEFGLIPKFNRPTKYPCIAFFKYSIANYGWFMNSPEFETFYVYLDDFYRDDDSYGMSYDGSYGLSYGEVWKHLLNLSDLI